MDYFQKITKLMLNNKQHESPCKSIIVVGGGRWGKIIAKSLLAFDFVDSIALISKKNYLNTNSWYKNEIKSTPLLKDKLVISNNLNKYLNSDNYSVAIVANSPYLHYDTSKMLLENRKHVLVEKPFVKYSIDAEELISIAKKNRLIFAVGHEFYFVSYLYHFKNVITQKLQNIKSIKIIWNDVFKENKHGEIKIQDMTVNSLNDIYPHIYTIIDILFDKKPTQFNEVIIDDGGDTIEINQNIDKVGINIHLSRNANNSKRNIIIKDQNSSELLLDFTKEPGTIYFNQIELTGDLIPREFTPSLNIELFSFFNEIKQNNNSSPIIAEKLIDLIKLMETGNDLIAQQKMKLFKDFLLKKYSSKLNQELISTLREYLLVGFLEENLIQDQKDVNKIDYWIKKSLYLIHTVSNNPFYLQKNLIKNLKISKDELIILNKIIRESTFCQKLITNHGHGVKYWINSIFPLVQDGVVDASLNNQYKYPHRIGLYLGPSCMFYCTFCGRNYDAKFNREDVPVGNEIIKNIFNDAPKNDPNRFYISGGLEPLANNAIGDIVQYGSKQGFKLSLYTNGYLLSPRFLEKHPGLWDLDILRFSIYGSNKQSYIDVTKNNKSFDRVKQNAINFLKLRQSNGSDVKFGFNFVVLPGCSDQVLELADLISEINVSSGADRQIDFLTLREDYSCPENIENPFEEQESLINCFNKLSDKLKRKNIDQLYIDYGYALYGSSVGFPGPSLRQVDSKEIRPKGYPQISIVVDLLGDVYLYREAGFIDRPGAERYIIGRITQKKSLDKIIKEFINKKNGIATKNGDIKYFDAFDHLVTKLLNQAEADENFGIPFDKGPIQDRIFNHNLQPKISVSHPTLAHPTLPGNK